MGSWGARSGAKRPPDISDDDDQSQKGYGISYAPENQHGRESRLPMIRTLVKHRIENIHGKVDQNKKAAMRTRDVWTTG
ncbi:hypothetical protein MASR2M79_16940 [Aminivibrio sp.]